MFCFNRHYRNLCIYCYTYKNIYITKMYTKFGEHSIKSVIDLWILVNWIFSQIIFPCCNHFNNHKHKGMYSYTLTSNSWKVRQYLAKYCQFVLLKYVAINEAKSGMVNYFGESPFSIHDCGIICNWALRFLNLIF